MSLQSPDSVLFNNITTIGKKLLSNRLIENEEIKTGFKLYDLVVKRFSDIVIIKKDIDLIIGKLLSRLDDFDNIKRVNLSGNFWLIFEQFWLPLLNKIGQSGPMSVSRLRSRLRTRPTLTTTPTTTTLSPTQT